MPLIIPNNRNVVPVVLPCVQREISNLYKLNIESQVTQSELQEGENIVREWYAPWINLSQFSYAYYMGDGITKAIDLTRWEYADKSWTMLQGDYEWPMAFGKFKRTTSIDDLNDEVVYLSQPFAGTGNLWSNDEIGKLKGTVVLDLAYISTTIPKDIKLPDTVDRVFVGASKTFGTPFLRHGWMFSKKKIPSLDLFMSSIKYFSSLGFRGGIHLYKTVDGSQLLSQGFELRNRIVAENPSYNLKGDSWLIANTTREVGEHLKRGDVYRVPLGDTMLKILF
jgi:hypothetical protein